LTSWTTRKNYPTVIGISLPTPDPVGGEFHECQLWEEAGDLFDEERNAEITYTWMIERLRGRSNTGALPEAIPESITEATVQNWKDGGAGYILFTPNDCIMTPLNTLEVQVVGEYEMGYMKIGMGNAYTIKMLEEEFQIVTQRQ
jgi:hypothetical protein